MAAYSRRRRRSRSRSRPRSRSQSRSRSRSSSRSRTTRKRKAPQHKPGTKAPSKGILKNPPKKKKKVTIADPHRGKGGKDSYVALAHRAVPSGYLKAVALAGAPSRMGKLFNTQLKAHLGSHCRVAKDVTSCIERRLAMFIRDFARILETNAFDVDKSKSQYCREHQQYF